MKPTDEIGSSRRNGSEVPSARSRYSQRSVRKRWVTINGRRGRAPPPTGPARFKRGQHRVPVHSVHGVDDADGADHQREKRLDEETPAHRGRGVSGSSPASMRRGFSSSIVASAPSPSCLRIQAIPAATEV